MNISDKKVLLVEPNFPIPNKSRNHKNFLPIGLLKIGSYLKSNGNDVHLVRFESKPELKLDDFAVDDLSNPDYIFITSLFTYWASYVKDTVSYYKARYPDAYIVVGGIYASLMPDHCKNFTGCDEVHMGVWEEAEKCLPDYSEVDVDFQIIHTSRGCTRRCDCCGVYLIEPKFSYKNSIMDEIFKKNIVFYDNNLLANPFIENILEELILLRKSKKISYCESQSGFDGRILVDRPELAKMIKKANFKYPKIAWDGSYSDKKNIKNQINIFLDAGYKSKEISVFMLFNGDLDFVEMEKKRVSCWEWNVQISDCRYRPLDQVYDNYNAMKKNQSKDDYYIHDKWTDKEVKLFRSNIRKQNICVRQDITYYSAHIERKRVSKEKATEYKHMPFEKVKKYLDDAWDPGEVYL